MPAFLVQILVSLVLKFGLAWIMKRFPGLPADVKLILEETAGELTQNKETRRKILRRARARVTQCVGTECEVKNGEHKKR